MLFARVAPNAVITPITRNALIPALLPKGYPAVAAITMFEGPANGIMLKPKENRKTNMIIDVAIIFGFPSFL
jgi:hypothetical protein